jgi:CubicO group peptidase (beta-lactamase class C family)
VRLAAALLACTALAAQGPIRTLDGRALPAAEVDRIVAGLMKAGRVTGLGVVILNDDRVVYRRAFGLRDVPKGDPLTENSVMYAASLLKPLFAVMVMQLVEEKVLDLDRPILRYLQKPIAAYDAWKDLAADPRSAKITARMLLSHTAGFANFRWMNEDKKLHLFFEPGSRYAYSGEGLNLLQFVLEEVTGKSLTQLVRERILTPFGMGHSDLVWRDDFAADLALGHDEDGKPLGHERWSRPNAAGSMDTTLRDMATFLEGFMQGKGLGAKARAEMLRPQIRIHAARQFPTLSPETTTRNRAIDLAYGLGWGLFTSKPHGRAWFKEGHDDGWQHHMVLFPDRHAALLLMGNSDSADGIFKALLEQLLDDRDTPWAWEGYEPYDAKAR